VCGYGYTGDTPFHASLLLASRDEHAPPPPRYLLKTSTGKLN